MKPFALMACLSLCSFASAQDGATTSYEPLSPVGGWENFKASIEYPELARRAGIDGVVFVFIRTDVNGAIDSLEMWGFDTLEPSRKGTGELFIGTVKRAIAKTKWSPAMYDGRPVRSSLTIPLVFFMAGIRKPLMIEGKRPAIQVVE